MSALAGHFSQEASEAGRAHIPSQEGSTPSPAPTFAGSAAACERPPAELEDIARKVDESLRKGKLNTVDKLRRRSEAHARAYLESAERVMLNVIDFSHGQEPWEKRVAWQRAFARATVVWLDANPGCDLDEAEIAKLRRLAANDLQRACELELALREVQGIEENWEEGAPSRTQKRLKELLDEELDGVGRWLTSALLPEQVEILSRWGYAAGGSWRRRPRWRLERLRYGKDSARVHFLDVRVRARLSESFEHCLRQTVTQRDVRSLLAIWATEAQLVRDAQGTRFVGCGFEIWAI